MPIVDTLEVTPVGKFRAKFRGEVLDTGGRSGLLMRGFLISEKPEPELEDEDVMRLDVKGNRLGEFPDRQINCVRVVNIMSGPLPEMRRSRLWIGYDPSIGEGGELAGMGGCPAGRKRGI